MYIPKARKLPSGSWQVRVTIDGQQIPITRPTKKEAEREAAALKSGAKRAMMTDKTLTQAIDAYIESKSNILSPSTIRGYRQIQRHRFQQMMHRKIREISRQQWQAAVDSEKLLCSAKTLTNAWRFISSVIYMETERKILVTLPQVIDQELPWLMPEQILSFTDALSGTRYEIPALLGLSSLRRSEILAVTWDDVDLERGCIFVRGAVVPSEDHSRFVYKKENKNKSSRRMIPFIIPPLRAALEAQPCKEGPVVTLSPNAIRDGINRICQREGLPEIGFHGLRRSFLSLAYHLHVPMETALRIGGWNNDAVAKKVYLKISENDYLKEGEKYTVYFSDSKIGTEIGTAETKALQPQR